MKIGNRQEAERSSKRAKILCFTLCALLLAPCYLVRAQQGGKIPRVGYLSQVSAEQEKYLLDAFRQGLRELGYTEGNNIVIERRYAEGNRGRSPALAAELVSLNVDVIVAGPSGVRAAKKLTSTIPLIFTFSADPVKSGLVASLARPEGNVTGMSDYHGYIFPKRLELLKEVAPSISRVAVLASPTASTAPFILKDLQAVAPAFGVTLIPLGIKSPNDVERAFAKIKKDRIGGLLQSVGTRRNRSGIINLAARSALPAIYTRSAWVSEGGMMSYGTSRPDLYRRAAVYVDKILKGSKPADLPVERPVKFELVINLNTANRIGLTIPPNVLARADKVIK